MKKLGNLILPDSLQWTDQYSLSPVTQTVAHTLAGTPVVFSRKGSGLPITLAATGDTTWLDLTTTKLLAEMSEQVGVIYSLIWNDLNFNVIFRHHEPPAISLTPLWPHHDHFTGTIRLTQIQ
ncbi:MAG: hypothetical protein HQL70_10110 [Magnetococcales bacterium]|nr:hypothetical protein [Magnetococcales bacterium]